MSETLTAPIEDADLAKWEQELNDKALNTEGSSGEPDGIDINVENESSPEESATQSQTNEANPNEVSEPAPEALRLEDFPFNDLENAAGLSDESTSDPLARAAAETVPGIADDAAPSETSETAEEEVETREKEPTDTQLYRYDEERNDLIPLTADEESGIEQEPHSSTLHGEMLEKHVEAMEQLKNEEEAAIEMPAVTGGTETHDMIYIMKYVRVGEDLVRIDGYEELRPRTKEQPKEETERDDEQSEQEASEEEANEQESFKQLYVLRSGELFPADISRDDGTKADVPMSNGLSGEALENHRAMIKELEQSGSSTYEVRGPKGHTETTECFVVSTADVVGSNKAGEPLIEMSSQIEHRSREEEETTDDGQDLESLNLDSNPFPPDSAADAYNAAREELSSDTLQETAHITLDLDGQVDTSPIVLQEPVQSDAGEPAPLSIIEPTQQTGTPRIETAISPQLQGPTGIQAEAEPTFTASSTRAITLEPGVSVRINTSTSTAETGVTANTIAVPMKHELKTKPDPVPPAMPGLPPRPLPEQPVTISSHEAPSKTETQKVQAQPAVTNGEAVAMPVSLKPETPNDPPSDPDSGGGIQAETTQPSQVKPAEIQPIPAPAQKQKANAPKIAQIDSSREAANPKTESHETAAAPDQSITRPEAAQATAVESTAATTSREQTHTEPAHLEKPVVVQAVKQETAPITAREDDAASHHETSVDLSLDPQDWLADFSAQAPAEKFTPEQTVAPTKTAARSEGIRRAPAAAVDDAKSDEFDLNISFETGVQRPAKRTARKTRTAAA